MTRSGRLVPRYVLLAAWLAAVGGLGIDSGLQAQDFPPEVLAYADLVLYNGKILTVDEKFTIAQAIALRGGKVLAVGDSARVVKMAGPKTQKIDLAGKSVVPGFINPHGPLTGEDPSEVSGIASAGELKAVDVDGYLRELKPFLDNAKPGEWVIAHAKRVPPLLYGLNRKLLDALSPNNPVKIEFDTSWSIVNSKALGYLPSTDMPGVIKGKDGQPTGTVRVWANGVLAYEAIPWPKDLEPLYKTTREELEKYRALGVTTVGGRYSGLQVTSLHELWARKELPTRVAITHEFPMYNPNAEAFFKRLGNIMGVGDDWFKITGATVGPVDGIVGFGGTFSVKPKIATIPTGSFGLYGENKWAWTQTGEGYEPAGDMKWKENSEYTNIIIANRYGWNITDMHTQGDGGMEIVLEAAQEANREKAILSRRFGNCHTIMRTPEQIQEMAKLGMTACVSPKYLFHRGAEDSSGYGLYVKQYGADAVNGMSPVKSLIQAGVKVSVEPNRPFDDPRYKSYLMNAQDFITRTNEADGKVWGKQEAIGREDALRTATIWSAYFYFLEDTRGSLEPGKLADLVILGGDYMSVPENKIGELPILTVIIDGKIVYQKTAG
ncbi:MAG: amidohydrolase family protein [Acidobacteria bacterium]|nr:amidohydrolase family protein [Acidobacteriota bacterium]